jgi:glyoxylase-like metal-dependent hydrolase (beta-lactamase superfamily II)
MNLLRAVEGTEVWAPSHVAGVLERPLDQDLPCTWYEPIPVDRRLPPGGRFRWHEYEITVHDLPGHTLYAAAYEFVVDGVRVLATGDQQVGMGGLDGAREVLNYQYRNRFRLGDYQAGARLYQDVAPQLMIFGHWPARWVDDEYFALVAAEADEQDRLHRELLPLDETGIGPDGVLGRIAPYYSRAEPGSVVRLTVRVQNPLPVAQKASLRIVLPVGWVSVPDAVALSLPPLACEQIVIEVTAGAPQRRARLAVDVTIGDLRLGQHAEAVIDVERNAGVRAEAP